MTKTPSEQAVDSLESLAKEHEKKSIYHREMASQIRSYMKNIQEGTTTGGTLGMESLPVNGNGSTYHPVQPGQYRRMKFGQALIAYLTDRGSVPVTRIAQDLYEGGVDTLVKQKTASERIRRTRITIGNNRKKLAIDEKTDTVRLIPEKMRPEPTSVPERPIAP